MVAPFAMPTTKKKRRSAIGFRCSLHQEALIAEAARRKGVSRGCLMRSAALAAATEVLGAL